MNRHSADIQRPDERAVTSAPAPERVTLTGWGRVVVNLRWAVIAAGVLLVAVGVTWGSGVFAALSSGGFDDPKSESIRAGERIATALGRPDVDVLVLYSSTTATVDDPAMRDPIKATLDALRQRPQIGSLISYYDTNAPEFVSRDRRATYVAVSLAPPDEDGKREAFGKVRDAFSAPGVTTQLGGLIAFYHSTDEITQRDLARSELVAFPVTLVLLVLIFGGLVAAGMPLIVGVLAILGALTTTRLLAAVTDVSNFAVNTIILLGLGMAIDYSLLVVSRFREELNAGRSVPEAVQRTMATAGRTVLVSGLTIALALASLLVFPLGFLRSMGLGGMAAVLVAMVGALTVLPALLAVLGPRINALRVPLPWQRRGGAKPAAAMDTGAWARVAHSVMRRPVWYVVVIIAVLAVFATPFLHVEYGGVDERVMPAGTESRTVAERIAAEFPGGSAAPIETVVTGASDEQVGQFVGQIRQLPGVTDAQVTARRGDTALISVSYPGQRAADTAYQAVREIRGLPTPDGVEVLVGGRSAADVDRLDSLGDRLPWAALIMAGVTLILLFLAFGSVLLPLQAVVMNLASIAASAGVLVWGFQDGHLADWLDFTPTGYLEPTIPILILVILFGLSTDYELFLISRIREERDRTGDDRAAVAAGLQRTGRIITAAALLLIVVVAGFTTGAITFAKMIGVGIIVAVVVDTTLVRALLVPATLRLLGRWTWWAPGPLGRVYRRYGIRE